MTTIGATEEKDPEAAGLREKHRARTCSGVVQVVLFPLRPDAGGPYAQEHRVDLLYFGDGMV